MKQKHEKENAKQENSRKSSNMETSRKVPKEENAKKVNKERTKNSFEIFSSEAFEFMKNQTETFQEKFSPLPTSNALKNQKSDQKSRFDQNSKSVQISKIHKKDKGTSFETLDEIIQWENEKIEKNSVSDQKSILFKKEDQNSKVTSYFRQGF